MISHVSNRLAFLRVRLPATCQSYRGVISGRLPVAFDEALPTTIKPKKPFRRWMSVTDLVTEVEVAMIKGVRLRQDGLTWGNLEREMARLRSDTDALGEEVRELKKTRSECLAEEESLASKLNENIESTQHESLMSVAKQIEDIDMQIACSQNQRESNFRDVAILRKTLSRIQKRDETQSLIDKIDEALQNSKVLPLDGPEAKALDENLERLQDEFDRVGPKMEKYQKRLVADNCGIQEISDVLTTKMPPSLIKSRVKRGAQRFELIGQLQNDLRKIAHMSRLRHIQIDNQREIGMLRRAKAMIERNAQVHAMIESKDATLIRSTMKKFTEDIALLRSQMHTIEVKSDAHADEAQKLILRLRKNSDYFTPEMGKQREILIENAHQEGQCKKRLAILRSEQMHFLRFMLMLKKALEE